MAQASRRGDPNTGGGVTTAGSSNVFVNNKNAQRPGDPVSGHCCDHPPTVTTGGHPTVYVNNKRMINLSDSDACGHKRSGGSPDVFVG